MKNQTLTKAAVQGATCGLTLGMLLIGEHLWHPKTVVANATQAATAPNVVRARRFEVVDSAGKVRATLIGQHSDGTVVFVLSDGSGAPRLTLRVSTDGRPNLDLYDSKGRSQVAIGVAKNGSRAIILTDTPSSMPRTSLVVLPDGSPSLNMYDSKGTPQIQLDISNTKPGLKMWNPTGDVVWQSR